VANLEPFFAPIFINQTQTTTTVIQGKSTSVGKLLVVEHISGTAVVSDGNTLDEVSAFTSTGQRAWLPKLFESRALNFGGAFGVGRMHQFGSPVRMYVNPGETVTIRADGQFMGQLTASIIGQLMPA
jgi:hypothetical protein